MIGMKIEAFQVSLALIRDARFLNLKTAGFPNEAAERIADVERLWRLKIAETDSIEAAILAQFTWSECPETWADWQLEIHEPPAVHAIELGTAGSCRTQSIIRLVGRENDVC